MTQIAPTVSCIVPAYNEAERIGAVLSVCGFHTLIDEVIVVDDGSSDDTADVVSRWVDQCPSVRLLRQPRNAGKSAAVARGVEFAQGDYLLFLDSDLRGLTERHLTDLLAPVLSGQSDASISLRHNAPRPWRMIGIDYISGERVMPRDHLAPHLDAIRDLPGFALEVFINRRWLENEVNIAVVEWHEVASPLKAEKFGFVKGLRADVGMLRDMFRAVTPFEAALQIVKLRSRRVVTLTQTGV